MTINTNMVKQPMVTLNTSVLSCGEYGGEKGQLMLSSGNNNEVTQENMRGMVIKSMFWADQREDNDEEGWGDEYAGNSTEEDDQDSEDEGVLFIGSPSLPKIASSTMHKLGLDSSRVLQSHQLLTLWRINMQQYHQLLNRSSKLQTCQMQ